MLGFVQADADIGAKLEASLGIMSQAPKKRNAYRCCQQPATEFPWRCSLH